MKQNMQQSIGILVSVSIMFGIGFLFGMQYEQLQRGGVVHVPREDDPSGPSDALVEKVAKVRDDDAIYGNPSALITVVEYSDFECPFCQRFHPTVERAVDASDGEISWVYRHLPLSFHPTAKKAAIIAECVKHHQGNDAFWQYAKQLFDGGVYNVNAYRRIALDIGVQAGDLDTCLVTGSPEEKTVNKHEAEASSIGIDGTPGGFVVNTKSGAVAPLRGAVPDATLAQIIDSVRE